MSEISPVRPMNGSPLSKVSYSVCNLRFVFELAMGGLTRSHRCRPDPRMSPLSTYWACWGRHLWPIGSLNMN